MKRHPLTDWIKTNQENIIVFIIMGFLAFFFLLNSPLHPWIGADTETDSSVFKTLALMMEKGYMPYKDSFDHKGPLIYILNFLGNRISLYRGIWVIEFLFMTITYFILYKIARLMCNVSAAFTVTLMSNSLLFTYFEGGNLSEEYALPFIASAIYIFVDYLKNKNISRIRIIICGCSLGATLLLRPNMISVWMVFIILIFFNSVIKHEWKMLGGYIAWFLVGLALIMAPILIWLMTNNALVQCWNDYILFNKAYSTGKGGYELCIDRWKTVLYFLNTFVCLVSFMALIYVSTIRDKLLNIGYIIYMIITLILMSISGMTLGHYGMILVPAVTYPLSLFLAEIEKIEQERVSKVISMLVICFFLNTVVLQNWISLATEIPSIYANRNGNQKSEIDTTIADIINAHVDENDTISVYGNWDYIYVIANRRHATRYSYQFPIGQVMPSIMEEYMEDLQKELPQMIIVQAGHLDDNIDDFLNANQYTLVWTPNEEFGDGPFVYQVCITKSGTNNE